MIAKLFKITRAAWIAFFVALIASFIMASGASAQELTPEGLARKYDVIFPIEELGGCKSVSECRDFCEDPVNSTACIDYAKQKGFYKEEEDEKKTEIIEKAKKALGCDSQASCESYCRIPTNYEKCDAFAKKEGLSGGQIEDPAKKQILEKAKEILGCDSYSSCASYCSDDGNRQKCTQFAKETGLRGGERPVGPGGCTSEETCKSFCSDPQNFQVCRGFASSSGGRFEGPGGCNSEQSCRSYCRENESQCRSFGGPGLGGSPPPGYYNPQEMCNRTPSCAWKDNTCQCGMYNRDNQGNQAEDFAKYCRDNPGRCTPGGIGGFESRSDRGEFDRFCRENPERCRPTYSNITGGAPFDPALECAKYQGCSWQGGSCACSAEVRPVASGGTPESSSGGYGSREDQERGCRSGGGTCDWSYGYCYCRNYQQQYAAPTSGAGSYSSSGSYSASGSYSGSTMSRDQQEATCRSGGGTCSWNGDTCNCQGYRSSGITTTNTSTSTTQTYTTPNIAPAGMSRDSQEAGCRSCGGTCSWSGDFCNCQCAGSTSGGSSGGSTTTTTQTAPVQETQTAPAPVQESAPQQTTSDPAPAVQGVMVVRDFVGWLMDFFR